MRVLLVIDALGIGGAERHLVELALGLQERGDTVEVACSQGGLGERELRTAGLPVHVLGDRLVKRRLSLAFSLRLQRRIAQFDPDVVHAHLHAAAWASALAVTGTRRRLVITEQTEGPWRGRAAMLMSRLAYARADRVIAVSGAIAAHLSRSGVPGERIEVVHNTVRPAPARARNGRGGTAPVIGVVARLVHEKGLDVFLEALARLREEDRRDVRATVVGGGPLRKALDERAARLGLRDAVRFHGPDEQARTLLERFDVLAVPSRAEGTPLTILEAMWSGVPIVATTAGGIPEQLRAGTDALLVPPEEPAALAAELRRLIDDPALGERLAASARRRVETEFSRAVMIETIAALYPGRAASDDQAPTARLAGQEA